MVFLPVLLFETALSMNVRRLMDDIGPILMMAIVAVVVCTLVVGVTLDAISSYGLVVCLLLGAIVATTDPVAVVGIFREVGAPKRLTTLVEGESLFNDAASIALYSVLLAVLGGHGELSVSGVFNDFVVHFIGGGVAGFAMGRLACFLFAWLRGFPTAEITLTLTLAYLSFFISEHYLNVSGVVATVIAGLVVGSTGRTRMSPTTFEYLSSAWEQFGFWANSLIFLFAAMLIPKLMAAADWQELALVAVLFVATLAARAIVVFGLLPLLGLTRLGTKVSRPYKVVMLWGGLRGAVSLALALAVTEQTGVPEEARQFIAVATTAFVLITLFVNGISLRPLIRMLGLNQLSPVERTIRNQALAVALEDLQGKTDDLAKTEHIGSEVRDRIRAVFDASLASVHDGQVGQMSDGQVGQMSDEQRVAVGLAIVAQREEEMFFDILKAQIVDWRMAESLLARAERLEDAIRLGGVEGFEKAIVADVRYSTGFRLALRVHYLFGFQGWLAHELGQRFANLMSKRSVAQRLILFTREQITPLLGEEATLRIVSLHQRRLDLIENAMQALNLQYPQYAQWLQESYLGRVARELERIRYRDMLEQFLISGEVYADLMSQLQSRWSHIDRHPPLDIELSAADLIKRVPLFEGLSADSLRAISKLLAEAGVAGPARADQGPPWRGNVLRGFGRRGRAPAGQHHDRAGQRRVFRRTRSAGRAADRARRDLAGLLQAADAVLARFPCPAGARRTPARAHPGRGQAALARDRGVEAVLAGLAGRGGGDARGRARPGAQRGGGRRSRRGGGRGAARGRGGESRDEGRGKGRDSQGRARDRKRDCRGSARRWRGRRAAGHRPVRTEWRDAGRTRPAITLSQGRPRRQPRLRPGFRRPPGGAECPPR